MTSNTLDTPGSFSGVVARDFFDMLVGDCLGTGGYREVYEYRPRAGHVIKVEQLSGHFENILEWEIWHTVRDTEYAKWFAPCADISANGIWLIQKRTKPCTPKQLPERVPAFFTDIKESNIGWLNGHPCFHDYGRNKLTTLGLTKKTKKIDWSIVND